MDHSNIMEWSVRCPLSEYIEYPEIIPQLNHQSIHNTLICQTGKSDTFSFVYFQLETIYKKAHASIRADPSYKKKEHKKAATKKRWNDAKLTLLQRKAKVAARKEAFIAKLKAEAEA